MHSSHFAPFNNLSEIIDSNAANFPLPNHNSSNDKLAISYSCQKTMIDLFVEQVQKMPDNVAVIDKQNTITYRELDSRSNQLANYIKTFGVQPGTLVPVCFNRSIEMIICVLSIIKLGGVYVPIDPDYPTERINYILSDIGNTLIITGNNVSIPLGEHNETIKSIRIDTDWEAITKESNAAVHTSLAPQNLVYVLYTSGSTGQPKGVCMGHDSLVNLLQWQAKNSRAGYQTRTLQFAPLSFDVSFQEIMSTLTTGGTLVLVDESQRIDLINLLTFIKEQSVNRLFLPFVALQYLTEAAISANIFPDCLQEVMTAGEQLKVTPQLVDFFSALPNCVLYNQYGPTESHVVSQLKLVGNPAQWPQLPSIGKAIDNVSLFIVNELLQVVPSQKIGELCISGMCLAERYLNNPSLTNERFIKLNIPEKGTVSAYRTGDLARLLPDGNIEFLGRQDDQVKIRGHRVELGEVEVVINHIAGVQQAVVVAREGVDGQKQLIAYLVASSEDINSAVIREVLKHRLPDYMMPSAFVWLDNIPLQQQRQG